MWFTDATERHPLVAVGDSGWFSSVEEGRRCPMTGPKPGPSPTPCSPDRPAFGRTVDFLDLPRLSWISCWRSSSSARRRSWPPGPLAGLLRANHMITGGLALPRCCTASWRRPANSSVPATPRSVCSPDGGLAEFVHVGFASDLVDQIGHLPVGKGLLGALIDDPRPIRSGTSPTIPLVRLSQQSSADGQLPRRTDPHPRRGVRQPLPHREHARRVQRRGRGTHDRPRRHCRRRDRHLPPVRGRPPAG